MDMQDCLKRADKLGDHILKTQKPVRDAVYQFQCGGVPKKSLEERLAEMSEDEKHAIWVIAQMSEDYKGLFEGFEPIEYQKPRIKERVEIPVSVAPPPTPKPKPSKKCFKQTKNLANCIHTLTETDRSEPVVKAASAICLCGGM